MSSLSPQEKMLARMEQLRSNGYTIKECQAIIKQEFGTETYSEFYQFMPFQPKRGVWDNMNLYLSYAMEDSERLQIPAIAKLLRQHPKVKNLRYWEGDAKLPKGSIDEFIEQGIAGSDVVIFICTANSFTSAYCKKESELAHSQKKWLLPCYEGLCYVPLLMLTQYHKFDLRETPPESLVKSLMDIIYPPPPEKSSGLITTKKFRFLHDDINIIAGVEVYKNNIISSIQFQNIDPSTGTVKSSKKECYPPFVPDEPNPDRPSKKQVTKAFGEFCAQLEIDMNRDFRDFPSLIDSNTNTDPSHPTYIFDLAMYLLQFDNSYFFQWVDSIETRYKDVDSLESPQMRETLETFWSLFAEIIYNIDGDSGDIYEYHMDLNDIMPYIMRIADLDSRILFDYVTEDGNESMRLMLGSYPELFSKYPGYDNLELEDDDGPYDDGLDTSRFMFAQHKKKYRKKRR